MKEQKVIVTVPAMFAETARRATSDAVKIAGLELIDLINEPTAAILHYASIPDVDVSGKIMVFDLGGGTFDVSIANVNNTDIEILRSRGDKNLGGHDFDLFIIDEMMKGYEKDKGKSLSKSDQRKLLPVAEKIKKTLSFKQETSEFIDGPEGPFEFKLTRDGFNELLSLKLTQIKMLMEEVLESQNLKPEDIDQTLLVGGSTRIPAVTDLITKFMGKSVQGVNVDEAVALGAALFAGLNASSEDLTATQKIFIRCKPSDVSNHYFGTSIADIDPNLKTYNKERHIIPRDTKFLLYHKRVSTLSDGKRLFNAMLLNRSMKRLYGVCHCYKKYRTKTTSW